MARRSSILDASSLIAYYRYTVRATSSKLGMRNDTTSHSHGGVDPTRPRPGPAVGSVSRVEMNERFTQFLDSDGIWCQVVSRAGPGGAKPALFLDRDGVIVEEVNYLHRARDVQLIPGAAEVIAAANRRAVPVIVIINQAGIGRGYFSWDAFVEVQETLLAQLDRCGASIDAVYACPHHPDGLPPYAHPNHPDRKPNPGMLLRAAESLNIHLPSSWLVGDKASDLAAGRAAHLAGGLHVLTGHGASEREAAAALHRVDFQLHFGDTIADARHVIPLLRVTGGGRGMVGSL